MKKVGIMSMQRITNYGSFLQAYGLKKVINSLGFDVTFVDYEFEKDITEDAPQKSLIAKIIMHYNIYEYLKKKKHIKLFQTEYKKILKKYLEVDDEKNYYPRIDTLVIGSDEVFNCLQKYPVGYSRNLFGYGYDDKDVISYAASFGHTDMKGLKKYKIDHEIGNMLNKFKAISVRDENSYKIVKELTNKEAIINLDPVLISSYDEELKEYEISLKNYIVVYAYSGRLSREEEKYIKNFAKKYHKKIVSLGFYQKIADYNLVVDPFEALKYIKNADYVITDTFHGSIFSIKLNTKFCTIIRKSNYNKLHYLLAKLGHLDQMVNDISDIERIYNKEISFKESDKTIREETKKTIDYLKKNI